MLFAAVGDTAQFDAKRVYQLVKKNGENRFRSTSSTHFEYDGPP
jgi:hypothetical protein